MKKALSLILALALVLCLAACGGKTSSGNENESGASASAGSGSAGAQAAQFENKIALSLDKAHYDQAERIEVTMDFEEVDQDNAVIVITSAELPHGGLTPPEEDTEEYRWIADFSEIPFYLWAPEKDGIFNVRIYAGGNNEELASVTFTVGGATLPLNGGGTGAETGGGRYALQSRFERGIVEIMDGKAAAFEYAAFNTAFDPKTDGIYPGAAGADAAWVTAGDGMYQHITLTADSLHIWADEVPDGIMAAPVRDITIER